MEKEKRLEKEKTRNTHLVKPKELLPDKPNFVKLEKNLITLGFFTPSSKRIKGVKEKVITSTRIIDGKKIQAKTRIVPSAVHGLPITADQDRHFALQKIVGGIRQRQGALKNPIGFSSAELTKLLNEKKGGRNYRVIDEWLDVMITTTVISEWTVYLAGRKTWVKDRFKVFERAVSFGEEMPDGTIADKNYVWLSEWQLENINNNHLLPADYDCYRKIKNHIAKSLIPILQVGLYATHSTTQDGGDLRFEKSYRDLCEFLGITRFRYLSQILQQLKPSLDELKVHGYISEWQIEPTVDRTDYKIIFYHGKKFYQDAELRKERREQIERPRRSAPDQARPKADRPSALPADLLISLIDFGFSRQSAENIIRQYPEAEIRQQLDAYRFRARRVAIENPQGFLLEAIKHRWIVPDAYREARVGQFTGEVQAAPQSEADEKLLRAYYQYLTAEAEKQVNRLSPEEVAAIRKYLLTGHRNHDYYQQCKAAGTLDKAVHKYLVLERRQTLEYEITFERFLALQNCV